MHHPQMVRRAHVAFACFIAMMASLAVLLSMLCAATAVAQPLETDDASEPVTAEAAVATSSTGDQSLVQSLLGKFESIPVPGVSKSPTESTFNDVMAANGYTVTSTADTTGMTGVRAAATAQTSGGDSAGFLQFDSEEDMQASQSAIRAILSAAATQYSANAESTTYSGAATITEYSGDGTIVYIASEGTTLMLGVMSGSASQLDHLLEGLGFEQGMIERALRVVMVVVIITVVVFVVVKLAHRQHAAVVRRKETIPAALEDTGDFESNRQFNPDTADPMPAQRQQYMARQGLRNLSDMPLMSAGEEFLPDPVLLQEGSEIARERKIGKDNYSISTMSQGISVDPQALAQAHAKFAAPTQVFQPVRSTPMPAMAAPVAQPMLQNSQPVMQQSMMQQQPVMQQAVAQQSVMQTSQSAAQPIPVPPAPVQTSIAQPVSAAPIPAVAADSHPASAPQAVATPVAAPAAVPAPQAASMPVPVPVQPTKAPAPKPVVSARPAATAFPKPAMAQPVFSATAAFLASVPSAVPVVNQAVSQRAIPSVASQARGENIAQLAAAQPATVAQPAAKPAAQPAVVQSVAAPTVAPEPAVVKTVASEPVASTAAASESVEAAHVIPAPVVPAPAAKPVSPAPAFAKSASIPAVQSQAVPVAPKPATAPATPAELATPATSASPMAPTAYVHPAHPVMPQPAFSAQTNPFVPQAAKSSAPVPARPAAPIPMHAPQQPAAPSSPLMSKAPDMWTPAEQRIEQSDPLFGTAPGQVFIPPALRGKVDASGVSHNAAKPVAAPSLAIANATQPVAETADDATADSDDPQDDEGNFGTNRKDRKKLVEVAKKKSGKKNLYKLKGVYFPGMA